MKVEFIFLTHNRLEYTKPALESVLADPSPDFALTLWDNASNDGTADYLKSIRDPRIRELVFSKTNVPQTTAVAQVWQNSKAELVGKLDNDCLVPPGWVRTLTQAHDDIPNLGTVACWPFFADDFDYPRAKRKIQRFGNHQILRHPWTCGTGFILKRRTFEEMRPLEGGGMTGFFIKLALHGYINGFYYPLLFQDHMDDPKSSYCRIKTEEAFKEAAKVTAVLQSGRFSDMSGYMGYRQAIIDTLLEGTIDPRAYSGWRDRVRRGAKWARKTLGLSSVQRQTK